MSSRTFNRHSLTRIAFSVLGITCLSLGSLSLQGCSTVAGVGKDVQWASEKTAEAFGGNKTDDDQ